MVTKTHYKMSLKTVSYYLQTWYKKSISVKTEGSLFKLISETGRNTT